MGFSWSLYFCQSVSESSVARSLPQAELISDGAPLEFPAKRRILSIRDTQSWLRVYIYVDNLGVFAPTAEAARAALDAIIADLSELRQVIHETDVSADTVEALGTLVNLASL